MQTDEEAKAAEMARCQAQLDADTAEFNAKTLEEQDRQIAEERRIAEAEWPTHPKNPRRQP